MRPLQVEVEQAGEEERKDLVGTTKSCLIIKITIKNGLKRGSWYALSCCVIFIGVALSCFTLHGCYSAIVHECYSAFSCMGAMVVILSNCDDTVPQSVGRWAE